MQTNLSTPRYVKKRRRVVRSLAIIVVSLFFLAFIGTLALSYYVAYNLTHAKRKPITQTPAKFGLSFHNINFPARTDGLSMSGWLIPAAGTSDKIVIEAHGFRENRSSQPPALPVAKALHDAGYAVMLFDFRDEGKSEGTRVTVGYDEQRDLLGAVDYAKSLGYRHVGLIGYSMGASTALEVTAKDTDVQATIADSPFANLHDYLVRGMPVWTHLPSFPFTPEILWESRVFQGVDARQVDPLGDLKLWRPRPLLLIAGTKDDTIPMSNSQALYHETKQAPHVKLWIVPGAKHVGAYKVDPNGYIHRVVAFFETKLSS